MLTMEKTFCLRLSNGDSIHLPKPSIMGIINASPNSFFNSHPTVDCALTAAENMIAHGAGIIDIGGEATNPCVDIDREAPSFQLELDRVVPLIEAVKKQFDVLVSVDTSRPQVMRAAVKAGADIINDQRALAVSDAMRTVATLQAPVCLMHFSKAQSDSNLRSPADLLEAIKKDLLHVIEYCEKHGITHDKIILDPGFGQGNFGKNCAENYYLLAQLQELNALGYPVLVGWSRKSMVGDVLGGVAPEQRLYGSIAAETLAVFKGAAIIRTHDVKPVSDAVKVALSTMEYC